jgi:hypothetical protein
MSLEWARARMLQNEVRLRQLLESSGGKRSTESAVKFPVAMSTCAFGHQDPNSAVSGSRALKEEG